MCMRRLSRGSRLPLVLTAAVGLLLADCAARAADKVELRDGDRVVWIGGTLIEREQIFGYWETMLSASYPDRTVTFRNLGWSGDTVWAESRGMFDSPEQGYARMLELVREQQPTMIILAYGANESFGGGERRLRRFLTQYGKLVDDLSPTGARFACLLPLPMTASATADPPRVEAQNVRIATFADAIRRFAGERNASVIDLSTPAADEADLSPDDLTADGVQWNAVGYWALAHRLRDQFQVSREGVALPRPAAPYPTRPVTSSSDPLEQLREQIVAKNELFFHRWRPQNFTYLFGFRNYEQGNNAVEIPKFDPLIEQREAEIVRLRQLD
ncbi:MAG: SGNH/GDSL hydrolase family protein [Planctomyces sp.]|nr:SGNH/GDSL hydrolase family protein [Planctomyces sp.]